jgi:hypothetical protein
MDRILFGDNQFFGVNHMSEEKARAQAMQFRDTPSVMRVLDSAYDAGIRVFMCTTHDRVGEIAQIVRADPARYPEFLFYPCMPYAHKYANSVGEVGVIETIRRFAPGGLVETIFKGAISAATKDIEALMEMLVDAEMLRFQGLRTPIVFVQNVVTDLLLGLGMTHMLAAFHRHIRERYGAEAGFITMNAPALLPAACPGASRPTVASSASGAAGRSPCPSSPPGPSRPGRPSSGCASWKASTPWSSAPRRRGTSARARRSSTSSGAPGAEAGSEEEVVAVGRPAPRCAGSASCGRAT